MLPAAFGRLCVETDEIATAKPRQPPAAFGRLCVETFSPNWTKPNCLPAAFGRLCVETIAFVKDYFYTYQPPSGGCVLKRLRVANPLPSFSTSRLRAAVC